jgi:fucose permease
VGLGVASGLLGLAWPSMRQQFHLSLDAVNVLYLFPTIVYSLTSFYIGRLMARFGSGTTLLVGTTIMVGCILGIAISPTWALVIAFSTISGLGTGILDAGLNLYVATYHTSQQMSWLHACFGIGITVGPLIMTFVLQQALGWQSGYAIVGALLILLVLLFAFTCRLWRNEGLQTAENKPVRRAGFAETLRTPVAWLSMATFLAYVGMEIGIGQWAYTLLTESRHMPPEMAGPSVSLYWGTFAGGRFLFGLIANRFRTSSVLRVCMLAAIAGVALFWWNPVDAVGILGLVVAGVAQAPIFPLLMSDTAVRVGAEHAENGISMQMGAVGIGAAILPGLIGTIGKNLGLETMAASFVVMSLVVFGCYQLTALVRARQPALIRAGG